MSGKNSQKPKGRARESALELMRIRPNLCSSPLRDRVRQNVKMKNYKYDTFITSDNDMTEEIKARKHTGN